MSPHAAQAGQVGSPTTAANMGPAFAAGSTELPAPALRWTRVSGAQAAAATETPSPRRADSPKATPPKFDLAAGLPRLLRAATGAPEVEPPEEHQSAADQPENDAIPPTAPAKRTASARLLSAPLPAWATALPAADENIKEPLASPRRRLRSKSSPAINAIVPTATSPPHFQLSGGPPGPASSLGNLLERHAATGVSPLMPPLKKPRTSRWMAEDRGTALMEIPIEALAAADSNITAKPDGDESPRRYPKRIRMRPLEFWRNERVISERLPGSATPSICRIALNVAPRAENLGERKISTEAVQQAMPVIQDDQELEFVNIQSDTLMSKLVVLPPFKGRANPPTYVLPPYSQGHIFVIEGSLRYAFEGEEDKAVLNAGDHMLLLSDDREALFASAGPRGSSEGVKFKLFLVASDGKDASEDGIPLGE